MLPTGCIAAAAWPRVPRRGIAANYVGPLWRNPGDAHAAVGGRSL